jgi:hypothetical protein
VVKKMILQRISVLIFVVGVISATWYVVHGQWGNAVGTIFYGVMILIVGSIARKDYENRMRRRARL